MLEDILWELGDDTFEEAQLQVGQDEYTSDRNRLAAYLNESIQWQTTPTGKVVFNYLVDRYGQVDPVGMSYEPSQLPNGLYVLGAINTFYNQTVDAGTLRNWGFNDDDIEEFSSGPGGMMSVGEIMSLDAFEGLEETNETGVYLVTFGS